MSPRVKTSQVSPVQFHSARWRHCVWETISLVPFFLLEAAWLNEIRCPGGCPSEVKKGSSAMMKNLNTGQTSGKKEDSLTEGVGSNSIGENLLAPSDQGTDWSANWQETEVTHARWFSQVLLSQNMETNVIRVV